MPLLDTTQLITVLESLIFFSTIVFHIIKKRRTLVMAYSFQSFSLILLLVTISVLGQAHNLLIVAILTFVAKVILAPLIFMRVIKGQDERMLTGAYINTPLTLIVVLIVSLLASSDMFAPLTGLAPHAIVAMNFALAGIFISLFLTMNRKGIVHQIMGVLSMENSIVAFGALIGIEQTFALELGMIFDVLMWTVGASVCIALVREHFGTLDTSVIKDLRD